MVYMARPLREILREIETIAVVGFKDARTARILDALKEDFSQSLRREARTSAPHWLDEIFIVVAESGDAGLEKLCRYVAGSFPLEQQAELIHTMRAIEGDFLHIPRDNHRKPEPLHSTMETFLKRSHRGHDRERLIRLLESEK